MNDETMKKREGSRLTKRNERENRKPSNERKNLKLREKATNRTSAADTTLFRPERERGARLVVGV